MATLDTQALTAFISVAECGSFSAAAEQLHLTQPAISKRISTLEEQLGRKLFDRIRKRVFLTEAGNLLLPQARQIILEIQQARQLVQDMDGNVSGRLRIAFSHHIGLHRLPPLLQRFNRQFPEVALDIDFVDSEKAYDLILAGKIELAVITLTPDAHTDIASTSLWRDPLHFVCSPEHALHLKDNVSLGELSEHDAILPSENTLTGKIVREVFRQQNYPLNISMTTNYLETIKMMVSIGLGWSVLPRTMTGELESIHTPDVYIERTLGIIEYRDRVLSNAANAFKTLLLNNGQ